MSGTMTIGELVGYVGLDVDELDRNANRGERSIESLAASVLARSKEIERQNLRLKLEADGRQAEAEIRSVRAHLVELREMDSSPEVDVQIAKAEAKLAALNSRLSQIRGQRVQLDVDVHVRGADETEKAVGRIGAAMTAARSRTEEFGARLEKLAPAAKAFSAAGMVPVLMATVAALQATSGAIGLLPAVAGSAAVGIGALKVGFSGFGDAMAAAGDPEKFAEALEKLSPAARAVAVAVRDLTPAWSAMKTQVQDKVFAGLADEIRPLGTTYIPMLGAGFDRVADSVNGVASRWAVVLSYGERQAQVNSIVQSGATVWENLLAAVSPLLPVFLDIAEIGGRVLAELTAGLGPAAEAFQDFIHQAKETGKLEAWIRGGVAALGDLFGILGNVGSIIGSVFRAANTDGAGLLQTVRDLTAGWAAWAASAEGQARMGEVFGALNTILQTTSGVLQTILPIVADLIMWFAQLPAPVQQAVVGFVVWGTIIGGLAAKIAPLISGLRLVGSAVGSIGGPIVTAAARWGLLGTAAQAAGSITGATVGGILRTMATAAGGMMVRAISMAAAWLVAMGPVGWIVLAVAAAVGLIIYYWDEIKAALIAVWQWHVDLAMKIWGWLTSLASMIATGASEAWMWLCTTLSDAINGAIQFLLGLPMQAAYALGYLAGMVYNGAIAAWRWLTETLPAIIDEAIAWLAGLPARIGAWLVTMALIVQQKATEAYRWLITQAILYGTQALDWISALPGRVASFLSSLPGRIADAASRSWTGFLNMTTSLGQQALAWIQALPGRIMGFFSGAGSWLVNAGRAILEGLWNGLKSMAQAVLNWISNIGTQISNGFKAAVGIHSPSRVFAEHGVDIGKGLLVGLDRIGPSVIGEAAQLASQVSTAAATAVEQGGAATGLQQAAQTVVERMRQRGPMYEDLTWAGKPAVVGQYNDQLLDMARQAGVNTADNGALQQFLEGVAKPSVTVNVYNPAAERTSASINREARSLSALGVV